MTKSQKLVTALLFIALGTTSLFPAIAQTATPLRKKLIEAGWDKPNAATLRQNLAQMEQTPFDGVTLVIEGKNDKGNVVAMRSAFSGIPWKKEWFQSSVDDLKAIRSAKLTDNFLLMGANPGNVDWFDDAGWKQIVDHWRIAAWVAKEGNLKGILLDPEPYTDAHQFEYVSQPQHGKHSFQEYEDKARQRGAQVMSAVASVDPNLVIFTFFMNSANINAAKSPFPQLVLPLALYGLYPAFINGWLDAAPPSMTFVDGAEMRGYLANSKQDFLDTANLTRNTALNLVALENRQKYLAQVQNSFGIYLDAYTNPSGILIRKAPRQQGVYKVMLVMQ
jgi:hypothetical protein